MLMIGQRLMPEGLRVAEDIHLLMMQLISPPNFSLIATDLRVRAMAS